MIKVYVCDKQKETCESIRKVIETSTNISVISGIRSIEDFLYIDIAFISVDCEINNMNGIAFAHAVQSVNPDCKIVFISDSLYYNEDLYDVNHVFLLQRPFREESVTHAIDIAVNRTSELSPSVFRFSFNGLSHIIPFDMIAYFEKSLRKIIIHTTDGKTSSFYGKHEDIEGTLDKRFLRCHNGIIVNMDYVVKYYTTALIVKCGSDEIEIPVSRTYSRNVKETINKYIIK